MPGGGGGGGEEQRGEERYEWLAVFESATFDGLLHHTATASREATHHDPNEETKLSYLLTESNHNTKSESRDDDDIEALFPLARHHHASTSVTTGSPLSSLPLSSARYHAIPEIEFPRSAGNVFSNHVSFRMLNDDVPQVSSPNFNSHAQVSAAEAAAAAKRVSIACASCHKAKTSCGEERPCKRCIRLGIEATCMNRPHKRRGRPTKQQAAAAAAAAAAAQSTSKPLSTSSLQGRGGTLSVAYAQEDDHLNAPPLKHGRAAGQASVQWHVSETSIASPSLLDISSAVDSKTGPNSKSPSKKKLGKAVIVQNSQKFTSAVACSFERAFSEMKELTSEVEVTALPLIFKALALGLDDLLLLWHSLTDKYSMSFIRDSPIIVTPIQLINGNQQLSERFKVDTMENWPVGVVKFFFLQSSQGPVSYIYWNNEAERLFCFKEFAASWKKNGSVALSNNISVWSRFIIEEDWSTFLNVSVDTMLLLHESAQNSSTPADNVSYPQCTLRCVDDEQEENKAATRIKLQNRGTEICFTFLPVHM